MVDRDGDALAHSPIAQQTEVLEAIIRSNPVVCRLLDQLPELGLPSWYLGAGGVAQTVWNHLHGFAPTQGIDDYDIVYFDPADLTEASERTVEAKVAALTAAGDGKVDVTNEARVHIWYEQRFGRPIDPYRSAEQAIATWPTTATSVGVRSDPGGFTVCAPFGLADLFEMVVRPNTTLVPRAVYEAKVERWRRVGRASPCCPGRSSPVCPTQRVSVGDRPLGHRSQHAPRPTVVGHTVVVWNI